MKPARIRVHLGGRYAGSRRWASFSAANERPVSLAVDERDIEGDRMLVGILAENDGEVLIRLPRAGVVGEWVAVVPRASITRDGTRRGVLAWVIVGLLVMGIAAAIGLWAAR